MFAHLLHRATNLMYAIFVIKIKTKILSADYGNVAENYMRKIHIYQIMNGFDLNEWPDERKLLLLNSLNVNRVISYLNSKRKDGCWARRNH